MKQFSSEFDKRPGDEAIMPGQQKKQASFLDSMHSIINKQVNIVIALSENLQIAQGVKQDSPNCSWQKALQLSDILYLVLSVSFFLGLRIVVSSIEAEWVDAQK